VNPLLHRCDYRLLQIILKQLVNAAIDLEKRRIFHQDLKVENILIETSSDVLDSSILDKAASQRNKQHTACFSASYQAFAPAFQHLLRSMTFKSDLNLKVKKIK